VETPPDLAAGLALAALAMGHGAPAATPKRFDGSLADAWTQAAAIVARGRTALPTLTRRLRPDATAIDALGALPPRARTWIAPRGSVTDDRPRTTRLSIDPGVLRAIQRLASAPNADELAARDRAMMEALPWRA
jgi:hypothetical protein